MALVREDVSNTTASATLAGQHAGYLVDDFEILYLPSANSRQRSDRATRGTPCGVTCRGRNQDPLASHIRLAADSLADGLLHGSELGELDLSGTLVVLSACETLKGPLFAGEGLLGLQRSFRATGASAVLATLWPLGESAADLVGFFYESLVRGDPPATALRHAQLRMKEDPATAHPFHWAGFVVHGGN